MLGNEDWNFCYPIDLSKLRSGTLRLVPFDVRLYLPISGSRLLVQNTPSCPQLSRFVAATVRVGPSKNALLIDVSQSRCLRGVIRRVFLLVPRVIKNPHTYLDRCLRPVLVQSPSLRTSLHSPHLPAARARQLPIPSIWSILPQDGRLSRLLQQTHSTKHLHDMVCHSCVSQCCR